MSQENGENNQDGHGADVNEDLGEGDEFGVQLQVKGGQAGEGAGGAEGAMHEVAQGHGGNGAAEGDRGAKKKCQFMRHNDTGEPVKCSRARRGRAKGKARRK